MILIKFSIDYNGIFSIFTYSIFIYVSYVNLYLQLAHSKLKLKDNLLNLLRFLSRT